MESKSKTQIEKLKRSRALVNEAKEIGTDTVDQMKTNNENLKGLNEKTTDINNKTDESKSILTKMSSFWRTL